MDKEEKIPYGKQSICQDDIDAVVNVLKSEFLTQGPFVAEFEKAFANYIGAKYAVAVSNGTAALHLSVLAMGVKKGDKVITTPITFAASANCVRYSDGDVIFSDIDPETYLIDLRLVEKLLNDSPIGTYKGIIPVNFAGKAVDLEKLRHLADRFGCWIIEDACHSPGGYFTDSKGIKQNCGNGVYADLSIFSFHPVKHITSGEGGMITTNDETLYKHLINLRTHGIQQDKSKYEYNHGVWYYEMQELGYNYRLTDIQAALGTSQLRKAYAGVKLRKSIAAKYDCSFSDKSYIKAYPSTDIGHAYHLYVIEVENRDELMIYLRSKNIYTQIHYIPIYKMPYYRDLGLVDSSCPNSEAYYKCCLSLPIFPSLTEKNQDYVIQCIDDFFVKRGTSA